MPEAGPSPCANCGGALPEPRPNFCPACGQETLVRAPRLGEFAQQFAGAYLSTEGALWRSLRLLLTRPGELTRQYLAGRRKHYVLPLRLYLTISLVVLLALRLSGTATLQMPAGATPPSGIRIDLGFGRASVEKGQFKCTDLPAWLCRRLEHRLARDSTGAPRAVENFAERFFGNLGAGMFVLLPAFALWLKLLYWNRRLHYTEHLVFTLHLHAFWFLAVALATLGGAWVDALAALAILVYAFLAARRVYGGRWWATLLRGAAISAVHGIVLGGVLGLAAVWTLVF
jgi:Protein of unknown function (DUF3667)